MRQDEELRQLLDRHGADPAAWPESLRQTAQDMAARDPRFLAALAEAQHMRQWLRALPDEPVPAVLWTRLFAVPERYPKISLGLLWGMLGRFGRLGSAAGMCAALVFGIWLGFEVPGDKPDAGDVTAMIGDWGIL